MSAPPPLRERLASGQGLVAIEAWDVLSAKVVTSLGFDVVSFGTLPDVGGGTPGGQPSWSPSELLDVVFKTAGEVTTPILVELPPECAATPDVAAWWARAFQHNGADAIEISEVAPRGSQPDSAARNIVASIGAVAEACDGLLIVAGASSGAEVDPGLVERLTRYRDAGAHVLSVPHDPRGGTDQGWLRRARSQLGAPVLVSLEGLASSIIEDLLALGVSIVSARRVHALAYPTLLATLEKVRGEGSLGPVAPRMPTFQTVLELVGFNRFE